MKKQGLTPGGFSISNINKVVHDSDKKEAGKGGARDDVAEEGIVEVMSVPDNTFVDMEQVFWI
mgnify:CR=1 FL=1